MAAPGPFLEHFMPITDQDLRNVRWGKSYLWDIRFPAEEAVNPYYYLSPPPPPDQFQDWFPAHSVTEPVFSVKSMPISTAVIDFEIPQRIGYFPLTINFYDTVWDLCRNWLWAWAMHMFSANRGPQYLAQGGLATRTLVECVRYVDIMKLTEYGAVTWAHRYIVYPTGDLFANLNSESGPMDYALQFNVVGGMFSLSVPGLGE